MATRAMRMLVDFFCKSEDLETMTTTQRARETKALARRNSVVATRRASLAARRNSAGGGGGGGGGVDGPGLLSRFGEHARFRLEDATGAPSAALAAVRTALGRFGRRRAAISDLEAAASVAATTG